MDAYNTTEHLDREKKNVMILRNARVHEIYWRDKDRTIYVIRW